MNFDLYLEKIQWEDSLFRHLLASNMHNVRIPLSIKLLEKHLNLNKKRIFFHICSLTNAKKIIKMQNLKNKPISCFIKTDENLIMSGVHGGSDYIMVLKGISLSDFKSDASSVTDKKGKYRLVSLTEFKLKNTEKIILNLYKEFVYNFYIKYYNEFEHYFKSVNKSKIFSTVNIHSNNPQSVFYMNEIILSSIPFRKTNNKILNKIKFNFIKEIMDFWKDIINKYKIYNTFDSDNFISGGRFSYTESIVTDYEVIEILSMKKNSFPNPSYKFKYFYSLSDIIKYINNYIN